MSLKTAMENYSEKLFQVKFFKEKNQEIFGELEKLETALEEASTELKELAKKTGQDIENDIAKVSVVERWNKYYNYDKFLAIADKKEFEALQISKGLKTEIDKAVFEELNRQGLISDITKQESFEEKLSSTAVIIKSKL